MGKITIQQNGIDYIIEVPAGNIKFESPNGGTLEMDNPVRIVSIDSTDSAPSIPFGTEPDSTDVGTVFDSEPNTTERNTENDKSQAS